MIEHGMIASCFTSSDYSTEDNVRRRFQRATDWTNFSVDISEASALQMLQIDRTVDLRREDSNSR